MAIKLYITENIHYLKELYEKADQEGKQKLAVLISIKQPEEITYKKLQSFTNNQEKDIKKWINTYRKLGLKALIQEEVINEVNQENKFRSDHHAQEKIILSTDGLVTLYENFFSIVESDKIFHQLLTNIQWQQDQIKYFGKLIPLPRLTAWYGETGKTYTYSGIMMNPHPWTPLLLEIKERIEKIDNSKFNSVLLNQYRDGQDSVAWHSDDEPELGENPQIASVSFGETRQFCFKHKTKNEIKPITLNLSTGSLLLMQGATQSHWLHQVPKTTKPVTTRINLTFRNII